MILTFGQIFNTTITTLIFKSEIFTVKRFVTELKELMKLSHSFVFKTVLQEDIPRKKAVYRTSCMIHVVFESFPHFILQSITNQKFHIWTEPFSIISVIVSIMMIILTILIAIKTEKYYL